MSNKYTTTDLYLAAFLKLKGNKITIDRSKNKINFEFIKTEELDTLVNNYLMENGNCEPLLYANSIKNLKNLLYNL
jgi:hypothetical protein